MLYQSSPSKKIYKFVYRTMGSTKTLLHRHHLHSLTYYLFTAKKSSINKAAETKEKKDSVDETFISLISTCQV